MTAEIEQKICNLLGLKNVEVTITIKELRPKEVLKDSVKVTKKQLGFTNTRQTRNINIITAFCVVLRAKGYSFKKIGFFLDLDHSTVMHHLKKYKNYQETNDPWVENIDFFIQNIRL